MRKVRQINVSKNKMYTKNIYMKVQEENNEKHFRFYAFYWISSRILGDIFLKFMNERKHLSSSFSFKIFVSRRDQGDENQTQKEKKYLLSLCNMKTTFHLQISQMFLHSIYHSFIKFCKYKKHLQKKNYFLF